MSIILIEGFDYYASVANVAAANWTINSTSLATVPAGRFAGQCLRHSGNSQRLTSRSIPGTNTLTLGVAIRFEDPENVRRDAIEGRVTHRYRGTDQRCPNVQHCTILHRGNADLANA